MTIYMKIDGIDGNVTTKGYEKWIEVNELDWNVNRSIKSKPGVVADREATKPAISELRLKKQMDQTSPLIFTEACVGKAKPSVKIHLCQTGESISPYMEYTLNNVLFSNYSVKIDKDTEESHATLESISLNFDKVEMKYTPYSAAHEADSPVPAGYDLTTAAKV
jgi:type VI secretion system secreted protein Hcp